MGKVIPLYEGRFEKMEQISMKEVNRPWLIGHGKEKVRGGVKVIRAKIEELKKAWNKDVVYLQKDRMCSDRTALNQHYAIQRGFSNYPRSAYRLMDGIATLVAVSLGYGSRAEYLNYLIRKDLSERGTYNIPDDRMDVITDGLDAIHDFYWWCVKQNARAMNVETHILYDDYYGRVLDAFGNDQPNNQYVQRVLGRYNTYKDKLKLCEDMEGYANDRLNEGWAGGVQHAMAMWRDINFTRSSDRGKRKTGLERYKADASEIEAYQARRDKEKATQGVANSESLGAECAEE